MIKVIKKITNDQLHKAGMQNQPDGWIEVDYGLTESTIYYVKNEKVIYFKSGNIYYDINHGTYFSEKEVLKLIKLQGFL